MSLFAETAFADAAACGDLAEVKVLLQKQDPALDAAIINQTDKDGKNAFHYSCLNDDAPLLSTLLADPRVDPLKRSPNEDTGLHMASLYAALQSMQLLKQDGRIALDSQNKYGETPLHLCAGSGDKGAAKAAALLLDFGANLTVTDKWKRGPMVRVYAGRGVHTPTGHMTYLFLKKEGICRDWLIIQKLMCDLL